MLLQVIVIIFALFALSRAVLRFKDKRLSIGEMIFWGLLWIGAMVVVLVPQITVFIAKEVGTTRGADLVVYLSIILIFYLMFKLYVRIDSLRSDITTVVREMALRKKK